MRKFKKIYIEITNICNLSCSFCPKTKRKQEFMSCENFESIIKDIDPLTEYLYFHLMGEPLLHPELDKLLSIAEKYNKKVVITTNGTLINKRRYILLKSKAIYKIVFSLHSFEANSSEISIEEYLSNIISFCKSANNTNIITAMRLWNFDKNEIKGENTLNDEILEVISKEFDIEKPNNDKLIGNRGLKLSDRIYLQTAQRFEWPDKNKNIITDKIFCYGLRDHFGIQVDGTVVPCCLDNNGEIPLGNIFKEKINDILESEKAQNIFNGFSNRQACEELCKRCDFVTKL